MNIPYFKKIDKKSFQRRVPKKNHPVRITIECTQDIPCDPCIAVCSSGAIEKTSLCSPPVINHNLCNGCLRCIASCPGQAIFGILSESVIIPWEYLPQPRIGENVLLCNREGKVVGEGSILDIQKRTIYDHTLLVHVKVPQNLTSVVRSFRRMDNGTTH